MINIQKTVWTSDRLIGLIIAIVLLGIAQLGGLQFLERHLYDWSMHYTAQSANDKVAVIAIDDKSLHQLGAWPWSRHLYAQLLDLLTPYSKAIGITLDFSDSQSTVVKNTAVNTLHTLNEQVQQLDTMITTLRKIKPRSARDKTSLNNFLELYESSTLATTLDTTAKEVQRIYDESNGDQQLAMRLEASDQIALSMPVELGKPSANALPTYILNHELKTIMRDQLATQTTSASFFSSNKIMPPVETLSDKASGIGAVIPEITDPRSIPLVVSYQQHYFPSLPLLLVAKSYQFSYDDIEVVLSKGVRIGYLHFNTDKHLAIQPIFYEDTKPSKLTIDSFVDVLNGKISPQKYQGKIVLLGLTASHYSVLQSTPLGEQPTVITLAHTVASLLNHDYVIVPDWAHWLQLGIFILLVGYLSFVLPHLRLALALTFSINLFILIGLTYFYLMNQGWIVSMALPLVLVPTGHLALVLKHSFSAYQEAFRLRPEAVENNRLLGLAFQGQGHLDLAFEKFRLCPPDEVITGLLYNLALDYEFKRQFSHAGAVYDYILNYNPNFRDVEQRMERLHKLKKAKWFRGHDTPETLQNWLLEEHKEKPTLGRYQIERQLGKGAMGIVYLGKDPKMDRLVALKTLALSQEFDTDELPEATTRFFREASAAGRLSHPYIISIFDAGEENDLAYISMEFFKGGNLVPYTRRDNLLPIPTVLRIIINVAEAVDYAYLQGVIHRDIKPANIMYNPATGKIKITDFGIARITDANKTKTGIILGTPSYMSPEQLAGKELDGRTDLFSLGVTLFQLLSGELPFHADSMATLMFKIANEPHQDIAELRADLPPCLKHVVDRALQKKTEDRYQTGLQFAQALYDCGHQMGEIFMQTLRENSNGLGRRLICN